MTKRVSKTRILKHIRTGTALALLLTAAGSFGQDLRVRFLTLNVDFNNTAVEVQADVEAVSDRADIMMFQEAKEVTIDNFLDTGWTVYQVTNLGDARRGSALAMRNTMVSQILATGLRFGVDSNGEDMLDRYIAWADVLLTNGRTLRIMSLHMPPQRLAYLQPPMASNFCTFANESPYPVCAGGDWNFTVENDPHNIQAATTLVPRGVGIDGFFRKSGIIKFVSVSELTGLNVNSDHDPVQMITDVTAPASRVEDWSVY